RPHGCMEPVARSACATPRATRRFTAQPWARAPDAPRRSSLRRCKVGASVALRELTSAHRSVGRDRGPVALAGTAGEHLPEAGMREVHEEAQRLGYERAAPGPHRLRMTGARRPFRERDRDHGTRYPRAWQYGTLARGSEGKMLKPDRADDQTKPNE